MRVGPGFGRCNTAQEMKFSEKFNSWEDEIDVCLEALLGLPHLVGHDSDTQFGEKIKPSPSMTNATVEGII